MNKYKEIVLRLSQTGIKFDNGLLEEELKTIEQLYNIQFPYELKCLYSIALPISDGFCNWKDTDIKNVKKIKELLNLPIKGILSDLEEDFWNEIWGEKPSMLEEAKKVVIRHYQNAPKLVPIFFHRFIPYVKNKKIVPVFSIHQSDIIYYGENLISYLEIEFGIKKHTDLAYKDIPYIKFWSDLV
jgi:hypothetical protein